MSYLDVPRLHFSGLFFVGPNTINNQINNFNSNINLENPPGTYDPTVAGWNPLGVAQWWLEECTVLSAVYNTGAQVPDSDPVINAALQSPSPKTPMPDGTGGYYDLAKMVDLDPWQQGRSALYGVRIACTLPNGVGGFQGLMTVPELRQLNQRVYVDNPNSWAFVGQWMGTLQNVTWTGNVSSSQFLTQLKNGNYPGLNVKLTVDLHQRNPANVFTAGDQFCYGRVLGSIGPAPLSEFPEVLPGRCLQTFSASQSPSPAIKTIDVDNSLPARERLAAQLDEFVKSRAANKANALTAAATDDPWNPAFAIIRTIAGQPQPLVSVDLGGTIPLNFSQGPNGPISDGTFEVTAGIVVGFINPSTSQFTPFVNGSIPDITGQYKPLPSNAKTTTLVKNSGVFSFWLTPTDGTSYQSNPLAIQVNRITMVQEPSSGYWIDVSDSSQRLECGVVPTGQSAIMVRKFGTPASGPVPVTAEVRLFDGSITNEVSVTFGSANSDGNAPITTQVNQSSLQLLGPRVPLDSQVYFIFMRDSAGQLIGDSSLPHTPPLTVLLFNAYIAPANPTWNDVSQIFGAYARLYPGMKSRLDISDQTTVVGDAEDVLERLSAPIIDPAYMPVTRDLSSAKMNMIKNWLAQQIAQS